MLYFPQRKSDIEVVITNNRPGKSNMRSGYRPAFKITDDYLASGIIKLVDCDKLVYGKEAIAEIWFLTPELYPNCLKIGDIVLFQEGNVVHGSATITKINNKILEKDY